MNWIELASEFSHDLRLIDDFHNTLSPTMAMAMEPDLFLYGERRKWNNVTVVEIESERYERASA